MKITGIIWLENIVEKLEQKHDVKQSEIKALLDKKPHFRFVEKGHHRDEDVYSAMGQTESQRYLVVFFVYKKDNQALVISAREMTEKERKLYERH